MAAAGASSPVAAPRTLAGPALPGEALIELVARRRLRLRIDPALPCWRHCQM
jgi:hypothetical protein